MPSDADRPHVPAWKKAAGPSSPGSRASRPGWRAEPDAAPTRRGLSRRTKLGLGVFTLIALSALLIWVVWWLIPPKSACLVLVGAGYEDNLAVPHNVPGWHGLEELRELAQDTGSLGRWRRAGLVQVLQDPVEVGPDTEWDRGLDRVQEKTVVVFLALHGGADGRGAFFLRNDPDLQRDSRLRLDQVLSRLEAMTEKKNVVLVVDATQASACWPQGMLHNDFARALRAQEERIQKIPNLVVLCASDVDQRSHVSEEWRTSIFTHYMVEGLKGAAAPPGRHRLTAWDLFQYVGANVARWARASRSERQTPFLLGGEDRARRIELAVVPDYQPARAEEAPGLKETLDLAALAAAWRAAEALQQQVPPPAAYTPVLWRRYLGTLLRYEELLRTGDRRRVAELKVQLDRLERDIRAGQALELPASAFNTLGMPVALGLTTPEALKGRRELLEQLWRTPEAEVDRKWEELQKSEAERSRPLLRLQLGGLLVERAAASPSAADLAKAHGLLDTLGASDNRRPAEVHYLALLQRDLDEKQRPGEPLLTRALQVRLLAEQVALALPAETSTGPGKPSAYSERVFPWIRTKTEQGDERRRRGEDRLFATSAASWAEAQKDLEEAEQQYRSARATAEAVRDALHTCHEARVALPYYARWAAADQAADGERVRRLEELAGHVHELERRLEAPGAEAVAGLQLRAQVAREMAELRSQFLQHCGLLTNENLPGQRRALLDALQVPFIPAELRVALLRALETSSHRAHLATADEGRASEAPDVDEARTTARARAAAERQGRMCLAVLGERVFNDLARPADGSARPAEFDYQQCHRLLVSLPSRDRWWEAAVQAGDEAALRWRRLPREVRDRLEHSRTVPLDEAARDLHSAERLGRSVDGAGAAALIVDPAHEARRLRMHDLLLWQAERTRHDHWFAEKETLLPYYREAGGRYLDDAEALVKALGGEMKEELRRARLAPVTRAREQLQQPGALQAVLVAPSRLELTSERQVTLTYRLEPTGWLPPGLPAVWLDTEKHLKPTETQGRQLLAVDRKEPFTFKLEVEPEAKPSRVPREDPATATLRGVYRGQVLTQRTPGRIHRVPDVVVVQPPVPPRAALAVRATPEIHEQFGPNNGAIAVVLDCSGSMGPDKAGFVWSRTTECKYHQATRALREVLEQLPEEATVSLFVYGQGFPPFHPQTNTPANNETQPAAKDTITRVRLPRRWSKKELEPLMAQVEAFVPWTDTPLVHALVRAKEEGFPPDFKGFKTILALTDGMDTEFRKDPALQQRHGTKDIATFLEREFATSGLRLNLVAFRVKAAAEREALKQFSVIERLPLRGRFYTVDDTKELVLRLLQSMKQRLRFRVERFAGGQVATLGEEGVEVSRDSDSDQWVALEPGIYTIRVDTDRPVSQRIELADGDALLVTLTRDQDGFFFQRVLHGEDSKRPFKARDDWRLTALQNQARGSDGLEMLLALETRLDQAPRERGTLHQVRPRPHATWFEVRPRGEGEPRLALRWGPLVGYPAPVWGVRAAGWPERPGGGSLALPEIHAYWNWSKQAAGAETLTRPANARYQAAFEGREVQISPDVAQKAVIESVEVQEREVEIEPGRPPRRLPCLVVRASYPAGNPVWMQVDGPTVPGQEHHFYALARKYTGIFWGVTEEAAQDRLRALHVIALKTFKNAPDTLKMQLELPTVPDNLGRPQPVLDVGAK